MSGFSVSVERVADHIDEIAYRLADGQDVPFIDNEEHEVRLDDLAEAAVIKDLVTKYEAALYVTREEFQRARERLCDEQRAAQRAALRVMTQGPDITDIIAKATAIKAEAYRRWCVEQAAEAAWRARHEAAEAAWRAKHEAAEAAWRVEHEAAEAAWRARRAAADGRASMAARLETLR
jgi:hypothetical protein